jgi:hypothetical protein
MSIQNNDTLRISRLETICEGITGQMNDVIKESYEKAVENKDEELAASLARKLRDNLLKESDSRVAFDRFDIKVPSGSSFSSWLSFLKSLGKILTSDWSKYRQELRDLPQQPGFPFDIKFPTIPTEDNNN